MTDYCRRKGAVRSTDTEQGGEADGKEKGPVFSANLFRVSAEMYRADLNPSSFNSNSEFEVKVIANGSMITVVADTGARINVLGSEQAKELNLLGRMVPTRVKIKPYNSEPIPAIGVARCAVSFGSSILTPLISISADQRQNPTHQR